MRRGIPETCNGGFRGHEVDDLDLLLDRGRGWRCDAFAFAFVWAAQGANGRYGEVELRLKVS